MQALSSSFSAAFVPPRVAGPRYNGRARHNAEARAHSREGEPLRSRIEASPGRFRWIVDGHNAIFAESRWESLQLSGRKREARLGLEQTLEEFGRAAGTQIWVVYDGNSMERNPDAVDRPFLRSYYSLPPEEADDRVRYLVDQVLREGRRPAVVTSDQRTLGRSLPEGVRVVEIRTFFRQIVGSSLRQPEKWEPGDLDDVERHFLSNSPYEADRRRARPPEPGGPDRASGGAGKAEDDGTEELGEDEDPWGFTRRRPTDDDDL